MSKLKQNDLDMAFSIYLTDSLYYEGKGMRITKRFYDIICPHEEVVENGDDIVLDIIKKGGLSIDV